MTARHPRSVFILPLLALLMGGCNQPTPAQTGESALAMAGIGEPTSQVTGLLSSPSPSALPAPALTEPAAPSFMPSTAAVTLDVELFYAERWMRVRQQVSVQNTTSDEWNEVVFNVPLHAMPESFFLDAVTVTLGEEIQNGTPGFFGTETILRVPLPRPARPGETIEIELRYRVVIPPVGPTDWPPIGTTGWTFDLIQAGEWYPALVPYREGEGWHTWDYRPVGDPTFYPLTDVSLNVTTEEGVTVVSGGPLGQEDGVWRFHVQGARGIAFLASDRYEMAEGEAEGIVVRSYYLPEHKEAGQAALEVAVRALTLFSQLWGPPPYPSLMVAENGFFGGMEYSGLISITNYAYTVYQGQPNSILTVLVAHETAHQWWYGGVGNDQANEPWLDESLAFYSELLYLEHYHPEFTDWWWEKRVFQYSPYGPVDATIYSYSDSADFILSMYGQAAQFLRDLRRQMGDDQFFAFMRDYYETYTGQIVTADDFFHMARQYANVDLTPLFQAYFANPPD